MAELQVGVGSLCGVSLSADTLGVRLGGIAGLFQAGSGHVDPVGATPEGFGAALFKMVAALVVVCVVAYLALRLARRTLNVESTRVGGMRVVERCPLSARQSLCVVEVAGRYFLIGVTEGAVSRLAELDSEQLRGDGPAEHRDPGRFRKVFDSARSVGRKGNPG